MVFRRYKHRVAELEAMCARYEENEARLLEKYLQVCTDFNAMAEANGYLRAEIEDKLETIGKLPMQVRRIVESERRSPCDNEKKTRSSIPGFWG